jgi:hypothetical protein
MLSSSLTIVEQAQLQIRIGIDILVQGLLAKQLSLEQVAHGAGTGTIAVAIQAQVLLSLLVGLLGKLQLLLCLNDIVACLLHSDGKQLGIIGQLFLSLLLFNLPTLDGM